MKTTRHFYRLALAALVLAHSLTAMAQGEPGVDAGQLRQALAERDAIIIDLLNRLQALEQRLAAQDPAQDSPAGVPGPDNTVTGDPGDGGTNGDFTVDELAAERALERGLVQRGVRLLRSGQGQIVPVTSYARLERRLPAPPGGGIPGELQRETEIVDTTLQGRLGLPFAAQLEVSLPYRRIDVTRKTLAGGAVQSVTEDTGTGPGNAR